MRKMLSLAAALTFSISTQGQSQETRFSAMVADSETGFILTADRIDAPRRVDLMGRLMTLAIAMQDLENGVVDVDTSLQVQQDETIPYERALTLTALGDPGYRAAMTALANKLGGNVDGYTQALAAVETLTGLQATSIRVVRGPDGGPAFEGYTTPRDMSRLATSMLRTYADQVDSIFDAATGGWDAGRLWIAEEGVCVFAGQGPYTGRTFVSVLTGAPDRDSCLEAAVKMISRDDLRIDEARTYHRPGPHQ